VPVLDACLDSPRETCGAASVEHGEVFTRRWVVDLILDLVGYTDEVDLAARVAVEPACGEGAFLVPMVERLLSSARRCGREWEEMRPAIRAYDVVQESVDRARKLVADVLVGAGFDEGEAISLARCWVRCGDFLLDRDEPEVADFVVGNPPYVRLEQIDPRRVDLYRRECPTMRGRSDLYVGFIECGLRALREAGVLGFIVADRWMHNQYGAALRAFVASGFSVDTVLQMHNVDAFEEAVSAYPAITVIRRAPQGEAVAAQAGPRFTPRAAVEFRRWRSTGRQSTIRRAAFRAARLPGWFDGDRLWPFGDPARLALGKALEERFPPLEDAATGTRVGIGVATGADDVYVVRDEESIDVEDDRLLPLVLPSDILPGHVAWLGARLVNPWEDGRLVCLSQYPRLGAYFDRHRERLEARYVARRRPHAWYRTIDRVAPDLLATSKLLLPDIKASIHPVLDDGAFYPHHNLYFVTSTTWDLEVLGGLLLSGVANLFVGMYCVKMRGGSYRFQAQYLRHIRLPAPDAINSSDARRLASAFADRDVEAATGVAARLYGIEDAALVLP
jgi:adenine-specific DNA-methyltransferase